MIMTFSKHQIFIDDSDHLDRFFGILKNFNYNEQID